MKYRITTRHVSNAAGRGGIRATYRGKSFTWPYDHAQNASMNHWEAAQGLADKLGLGKLPKEATGDVKRGGQYVGLYWDIEPPGFFGRGGRESNPSRKIVKLDSGYGPIAADWDTENSVLRVRPMSEWEMSQRVKAMGGVKISKDQQTLTFPGDERWTWDPRFNWWAMTKARTHNPSRRSVHTAKWDRCYKDVKARGGARSAAAVCTAALGERGSIKVGHRRKNPSRRMYRVRWHTFHEGSQYADGTLARLKPVIAHLIKQGTPYKIIDENGNVVREVTPMPTGKIRGQFNRSQRKHRASNPSGFQLEKTTRLYFMVHAHPHRGGGERLWLTKSGTLSADKSKGARYTSVEVAVARAKAFLKKHRVARKYRFDVCLSD